MAQTVPQKIMGRIALNKFWAMLSTILAGKQPLITATAKLSASLISGLANVAKSGSYNDLSDKPTIPPAITVDSAMSSTSTNPVQNKVINSALNGKAASDHTHGNVTNAGAITETAVTIANGDAIVITDASASGKLVKTSITFNGTTTNKFLSQKGTWEEAAGGISYEVIEEL